MNLWLIFVPKMIKGFTGLAWHEGELWMTSFLFWGELSHQYQEWTAFGSALLWECLCWSVFCCRCDGSEQSASLQLSGVRGPNSPHSPQQQTGQPGTHLQALEVEEKEKWKTETGLYRWVRKSKPFKYRIIMYKDQG